MAITWQNVGTPSFSGVAAAQELGGEALNRGLDQITKQVKGVSDQAEVQANAENKINKENYLSKINSATDLESLTSLGTDIDTLRKNTRPGFDVASVQQAAQTRKNELAPDMLYRGALDDFSKGMDPLELEAKLRSQAKKLNLPPAVAEQARTAALADYTRLSQYRSPDQQVQEGLVNTAAAATLQEIDQDYAKAVETTTQNPDYSYFQKTLENPKDISITELMGEATESEMWQLGNGDNKSGEDLQKSMQKFITDNPTVPLQVIQAVMKNATKTEDAIEIFGSGKRVDVGSFDEMLKVIGERYQKFDSDRSKLNAFTRTTENKRAVLSSQAASELRKLAQQFTKANVSKGLSAYK